MADIADIADIQNSKLLDIDIQNSLVSSNTRKGPNDCLTCGDWNDRADSGYATCNDCFDSINNKG